jgi:aryl-alcohol dehydrogenase
MHIRAAVTESKGAPFAIQEVELDQLRADEVLVRVSAAGICHTDLILISNRSRPVVAGAAAGGARPRGRRRCGGGGAGRFEGRIGRPRRDELRLVWLVPELPAGTPLGMPRVPGRNLGATRPDGSSALARDGRPIHSHFFSQSSFASYAVASECNVTKLDPSIPLEIVAPFGCGIQTRSWNEHRGVRHRHCRAGGRDGRASGRLHHDPRR